jgi:hypothetical protein
MSEIERYGDDELEPLVPVEWQAVKRAFSERYAAETRIMHGGLMTERAQVHLARIRARLPERPDQMDLLIVSAFAFGAAENIQAFMRGHR